MESKPLSLQQQCFVHLITNLEEFSPDILALLPLRVRRELFLRLPAADICYLEQTAVADGVDMDAIWGDLCVRLGVADSAGEQGQPKDTVVPHHAAIFYSRLSKAMDEPCYASNRERFTTLICSLLLSLVLQTSATYPGKASAPKSSRPFLRLLLRYLFSDAVGNHGKVQHLRSVCLVQCGKVIEPRRFEKYVSYSQFDSPGMLNYVLQECQLYPRFLFLNWQLVDKSVFESEANLAQLTSTVDQLQFCIMGPTKLEEYAEQRSLDPASDVFPVTPMAGILEAISRSQKPCLRSMIIHALQTGFDSVFRNVQESDTKPRKPAGELVEHILKEISVPLLSAPSASSFQGLKELWISTNFTNANATELFFKTVQSQQQLESLRISKRRSYGGINQMVHASLTLMHFTKPDLPLHSIENLVQAFLSLPQSPIDSDSQFLFQANDLPPEQPKEKTLHVSVIHPISDTSEAILWTPQKIENDKTQTLKAVKTHSNPSDLNVFDYHQLFHTVFHLPQLPKLTLGISAGCNSEHLAALIAAWEDSGRERLQKFTLNASLPKNVMPQLDSLTQGLNQIANEVNLLLD